MAAGSAHGEESFSAQVKYLAPFQQDHRGTDSPDASASPLRQRIFPQGIVVFVVPGHKGRGEGPSLQPVQALVIPLIAVPHTAEVTCHQYEVLFCKALLLVEDFRLEAPEISVEVSRDVNFHGVFS